MVTLLVILLGSAYAELLLVDSWLWGWVILEVTLLAATSLLVLTNQTTVVTGFKYFLVQTVAGLIALLLATQPSTPLS